jgi:hypothetical protein
MTKRKTEEALLFLPQIADFGFTDKGILVPESFELASTTARRRIQKESDRQLAGLAATKLKVLVTVENMAEMGRVASSEFARTAECTGLINQEAAGSDYELQVSEFNDYVRQLAAQQFVGVIQVGGTMMAKIVAFSPFPDESQETGGFLKRLLVEHLLGR